MGQELRKQSGWSRVQPSIFYYRTSAGREVDFVLENRQGRRVGIEVKAAVHLRRDDVKGIEDLAEATRGRFLRGIILYLGETVVPFAHNIHALPLGCLWAGKKEG